MLKWGMREHIGKELDMVQDDWFVGKEEEKKGKKKQN